MQRSNNGLALLYRLTAARYEARIGPVMQPLARDLADTITLRAGATLLDIGTGTGLLLRAMAAQNRRCIGIDIAMPMLRIAQSLRQSEGWPGCTLVCADANTLDILPDNCCDGVAASFGLSECDPERVLCGVCQSPQTGWSTSPSGMGAV
jgi:tRNA G46 methylase TrmB